MYKLMIVDDEPEIREHIKSTIDWKQLDLLLVAEASDADTAIENAMLFHPQIVVMDICLPGQDGLSLAAELMQYDSDVQILIVSGFQDFSYAKKAMTIGISDYLTKPIVSVELNTALRQITERFAARKTEQQKLFAINQVLEQNKQTLQKWQLESLLHDTDTDTEQTIQQLRLLDIEFGGEFFAVVLVSRCDGDKNPLASGVQSATIKQYLETKFQETGFRVHSFFDDEKTLSCLLSFQTKLPEEIIESVCRAARSEIKFYFGHRLDIGIGSVVAGHGRISESTRQARAALQHCIMVSEEAVVSWQNIRESQSETVSTDSMASRRWWPKLAECIRLGRENVLEETVDQLCRQIQSHAGLQEFGIELLGELSRQCSELGVYLWNIIDYPSTVRQLFVATDAQSFKQSLLELCAQLTILLSKRESDANRYLITKAKEYIESSYADPELSLEQVSSYVGLSRSYFSTLFHKVEYKTFKIYLMELRIRQAKRMLTSTDKKIYEISCEVGCSDTAYFNRVFKRMTGMTPLQFRNGGKRCTEDR